MQERQTYYIKRGMVYTEYGYWFAGIGKDKVQCDSIDEALEMAELFDQRYSKPHWSDSYKWRDLENLQWKDW